MFSCPVFGGGRFMGMMGGGSILMILFWILLIVGIIYLVRGSLSFSGNNNQNVSDHKTAEEILKERYAQGDIDKDEFERKKRDLQN